MSYTLMISKPIQNKYINIPKEQNNIFYILNLKIYTNDIRQNDSN